MLDENKIVPLYQRSIYILYIYSFDLKKKKEEEESMKIKCRKDYSKREELEKKELRSCSIPITRQ
jgi:hypothetical protein